MTAHSTSLHTRANLLAYRPEMVRRPGKSDIQKVEAIWLAADRALQAAALGQLRESPAGHALLNAIFDLTEAQEVYDLALEWGMHAGTVECDR